jgi:hypothetical protein
MPWMMHVDHAEGAVRHLRIEARGPVEPRELENDVGQRILAGRRLAQAARKESWRLPSDSRCLFRFTPMHMLERCGISRTLVIAVQPWPFGADAWPAVDGRLMLPDADRGYERMLEI